MDRCCQPLRSSAALFCQPRRPDTALETWRGVRRIPARPPASSPARLAPHARPRPPSPPTGPPARSSPARPPPPRPHRPVRRPAPPLAVRARQSANLLARYLPRSHSFRSQLRCVLVSTLHGSAAVAVASGCRLADRALTRWQPPSFAHPRLLVPFVLLVPAATVFRCRGLCRTATAALLRPPESAGACWAVSVRRGSLPLSRHFPPGSRGPPAPMRPPGPIGARQPLTPAAAASLCCAPFCAVDASLVRSPESVGARWAVGVHRGCLPLSRALPPGGRGPPAPFHARVLYWAVGAFCGYLSRTPARPLGCWLLASRS